MSLSRPVRVERSAKWLVCLLLIGIVACSALAGAYASSQSVLSFLCLIVSILVSWILVRLTSRTTIPIQQPATSTNSDSFAATNRAALDPARQRLDQIIEAARIATWDWDLITNQMIWSDNLERLLGSPDPIPRSLEGFLQLIPSEDHAVIRQAIDRALQDDKNDLTPLEFRVGSPLHRWFEGHGRLLRDEQNRPVRMLGTIMEITQRRLAQDQMRRASEAKSAFLASMSHEMRTPLNGIIGMVELLQQTKVNEQQQSFLDTLSKSAESLLSLVNDVLDVSKIEAGALELEEIVFDVRAVARDALEVALGQCRETKLSVACDLAADLPVAVQGDPDRLRQILLNLLSNAIKFTPAGRVELRVFREPSIESHDSTASTCQLRFEVIDTGIGIAPERQAAIFEPFTQAEASTSRMHGGTGLGLTISARLVERMGGKLRVNSQPGCGSTFSFSLPFKLVDAPIAAAPAPSEVSDTRSIRILLAEDNSVNQQVLTLLLEKAGYRVDVANNGHEALAMLERQPYDLVLMDVQMPEMDGLRATRLIRQREKVTGGHVPIVAVTANAVHGERHRCLSSGMDDYLSKPIRGAELFATMSRLLQSEKSSDETVTLPRRSTCDAPIWLRSLENMGFDQAAISKLTQTFLDTVPPRLTTLRQSVEGAKAEQVRQTAHSLKGSLTVFGVQETTELVRQLEEAGHDQEFEQASVLLSHVVRQIDPLLESMQEYLHRQANSH